MYLTKEMFPMYQYWSVFVHLYRERKGWSHSFHTGHLTLPRASWLCEVELASWPPTLAYLTEYALSKYCLPLC